MPLHTTASTTPCSGSQNAADDWWPPCPNARVDECRPVMYVSIANAEPPVAHDPERLVDHPHPVARGDRGDRLGREQLHTVERAAPEQHLVEASEFAHRSPTVRARASATRWRAGVDPAHPTRFGACGVVHQADAVAVRRVTILGHPDPAVVHPERHEDLVAHVLVERPAARARDDLAEHRHARGGVVTRLLPGYPSRLDRRRVDAGQVVRTGFAPRLPLQDPVRVRDAGRVREEVPERDAVLALRAELGDEAARRDRPDRARPAPTAARPRPTSRPSSSRTRPSSNRSPSARPGEHRRERCPRSVIRVGRRRPGRRSGCRPRCPSPARLRPASARDPQAVRDVPRDSAYNGDPSLDSVSRSHERPGSP